MNGAQKQHMKLEDLQANAAVRGILSDGLVTVVSVQWFGSEALELTYKTPTGRVANELLYRHDEARLEIVEAGRPWSFDGDGALFRLVSEAQRIRLAHLQRSNIAPVDLAQAAIGPGMAVYTCYAKVLDAAGKALSVREALVLINQTLDETLVQQEGDFDADSRWALAWFEQFGFDEGEYGIAEMLSKAKNTSVAGMVDAGILDSKAGTVRLLKPEELPPDWDPTTDPRLTAWEMVHHLVRALEAGGESAAAELAVGLGVKAEAARELCYRLYTLCERKKRAAEALSYNSLVQSWPEITRLAREEKRTGAEQTSLFASEDT